MKIVIYPIWNSYPMPTCCWDHLTLKVSLDFGNPEIFFISFGLQSWNHSGCHWNVTFSCLLISVRFYYYYCCHFHTNPKVVGIFSGFFVTLGMEISERLFVDLICLMMKTSIPRFGGHRMAKYFGIRDCELPRG